MEQLDEERIRTWLKNDAPAVKVEFPDGAAAIVDWVARGDWSQDGVGRLSRALWAETRYSNIPPR